MGDDRLQPEPDEPVDNLIISLRSYMAATGPKKVRKAKRRNLDDRVPRLPLPPSEWVLVFDCETKTTPDQRLRFGAYQLRHRGVLWESGFFYELRIFKDWEVALLKTVIDADADSALRLRVLTHAEFVEDVFYDKGYAIGAQIVGFNLPFDLSRLAIAHAPARVDMRGGFSLKLSNKPGRPAVRVKHISQRAALIRFWAERKFSRNSRKRKRLVDEQSYFVDVKTLAAALSGESHSLERLSHLLKIANPKKGSEEHGQELTLEYARYCMADVQATWECFDSLSKRFDTFGLSPTGPWQLYSEASLGKAYLRAMGVRPWRQCQPDFPPDMIGRIMTTYFGGRAEVHIRREIVPVVHCDFLSMYPAVCTLMGLWRFVCACKATFQADTVAARNLLSQPASALVEAFHHKATWDRLRTIVRIRPPKDLLPVRAEYAQGEPTTIGLNFLSSEEPIQFTLADIIASKILTGRTPEVLEAVRFDPGILQDNLKIHQNCWTDNKSEYR